ncbi:hypothetical protein OH686_07635 [Pseudomonas sp. SO81]|nr:hypothetical protein OH686_07635 [Pseudomonas sp. SO81]
MGNTQKAVVAAALVGALPHLYPVTRPESAIETVLPRPLRTGVLLPQICRALD